MCCYRPFHGPRKYPIPFLIDVDYGAASIVQCNTCPNFVRLCFLNERPRYLRENAWHRPNADKKAPQAYQKSDIELPHYELSHGPLPSPWWHFCQVERRTVKLSTILWMWALNKTGNAKPGSFLQKCRASDLFMICPVLCEKGSYGDRSGYCMRWIFFQIYIFRTYHGRCDLINKLSSGGVR